MGMLRIKREVPDAEWVEMIDDFEDASNKAQRILHELFEAASSVEPLTLRPERIDTTELAEKLRRRLRADHGRTLARRRQAQ